MLHNASALIVGLGGTGSAAASALAGASIGTLIVNDFDRIDASNLARQTLYSPDDIGELKATTTRSKLQLQNPAITVAAISDRLDAEGLLDTMQQADIVLDCCDNFASRFAINEAAVRTCTTLISGAAIRWEGQVAVFNNSDPSAACYRCLYQPDDESLEDCAGAGVIGPLPAAIGQLMALEAIKVLTSSGVASQYLVFDAYHAEWRSIAVPKDPQCPVCARQAASARDSGDGS